MERWWRRCPATAQAVFPGTNGQILFVSGRDGGDADANTYIIDGPNDTTLGPPTDLIAGQHRHPVWSADGRYIVYAIRVADNGCPPTNQDEDLYLHDRQVVGIGGLGHLQPVRQVPSSRITRPFRPMATQTRVRERGSEPVRHPHHRRRRHCPPRPTSPNSPNRHRSKPRLVARRAVHLLRPQAHRADRVDIYRQRADGTGTPTFITVSATNEFRAGGLAGRTAICTRRAHSAQRPPT